MKTVYIYSNIVRRPCVLSPTAPPDLPTWPLIDRAFVMTREQEVGLIRIKTSQMGAYKNALLGRNIVYAPGKWAFVISLGGVIVGFLEFAVQHFTKDVLYMQADFAPAGSAYPRLSKLVIMLAIAGETRRTIERLYECRVRGIYTTAFTDRPVSMKYRGVLTLQKRGATDEGQKFLNYGAMFNTLTWKETLALWLTKHGSRT